MIFPLFNFNLKNLNPFAVFYLIAINCIVFVFLLFSYENRKELNLTSESIASYGVYYWKFLSKECENKHFMEICKQADFQSLKNQNIELLDQAFFFQLGKRALVNKSYMKLFFDYNHIGDSVQISQLKEDIRGWKEAFENSQTVIFGSQADNVYNYKHYLSLLTYQFTHTGFLHLLGNMFFLFVFGCALSSILNQMQIFGVYLCGGICGILSQHFFVSDTVIPVIGASASVCSLIPMYLLLESKNNVRYFYFFAPIRPYFGEIYFSKWWLVLFLIVPDFTGIFQSLNRDTSTAHFAHLGGVFFGILAGFYFKHTTPRLSRYIGI